MTDTVKVLRDALQPLINFCHEAGYDCQRAVAAMAATERAAIQPAGDGWHKGAPGNAENGFYAFHPDLIDPDYNPHGVVEAVVSGDSFIGAIWNNCHDCWDALPIKVAMWRKITGPNAAPVCTPVQAAPDVRDPNQVQTIRERLTNAPAVQAASDGMPEFLANLDRSRAKYPRNGCMFDGLMGEVDELARAYKGDGDVRAEALDVAVCAFRIAVEGDAGGNTSPMLTDCAPEVKQDASALPDLPEWSKLDNLGGLVLSEIRQALRAYGQACIAADRAARACALPSISNDAGIDSPQFRALVDSYVRFFSTDEPGEKGEQYWRAIIDYIDARTPPVAAPSLDARFKQVWNDALSESELACSALIRNDPDVMEMREEINNRDRFNGAVGQCIDAIRELKGQPAAPESAEPSADLTADEIAFVRLVERRPGAKLNSGEADPRSDSDPMLWVNPQVLEYIESVGSFKWRITDKGRARLATSSAAKGASDHG